MSLHPALPLGLLEAMREAALEAGRNALRHRQEGFVSSLKSDKSLVTLADTEGETIIHAHLDHYGFNFIGEEQGEINRGSDFAFVVDPIDGTTNFATGDPNWMVSIGVTYRGEPIAGVTYQPELDKLYWAEIGQGAYLKRGDQVEKLDRRDKPPAAYVFDILSNRPVYMETAALHQILRDEIMEYTGGAHIPRYRSLGCPSVPLCQMAEGGRVGVICWPISLHDVAAAIPIVREAGFATALEKDSEGQLQIVAALPALFKQVKHAFDATLGKHAHFYNGRDVDGVVERMREDGIRYGVSVGRRQPMHQAHLDCIMEMIEAGLHPVIVIGSNNNGANPLFNPFKNPLNEAQQREQLAIAMAQAGVSDYTILTLPDLGHMEEWAASVRHLLKANGINPAQAVCHYRAKEDDAKETARILKPMNASNEALMRFGMSVWESYNHDSAMDLISATTFRNMDLQDPANQTALNEFLIAPDLIIREAAQARADNPDQSLLAALPVTMMDLTLKRLRNERGLATADILNHQPALQLDQLAELIKQAIESPSPAISGNALQVTTSHIALKKL